MRRVVPPQIGSHESRYERGCENGRSAVDPACEHKHTHGGHRECECGQNRNEREGHPDDRMRKPQRTRNKDRGA